MKIVKKTKFNYVGKVYDLCVENSHTYNVEGKSVHNSGAGSLVCYLMGITLVDPVEHGLLFERFLSENRNEPPDIDCLHKHTLVVTPNGLKKIEDIRCGDHVIDANGEEQEVLFRQIRNVRKNELIYEVVTLSNGTIGCIVASSYHKFLKHDGAVVLCKDMSVGDVLSPDAKILAINVRHADIELVDITVANSSSFRIIPFSVVEVEDQNLDRFIFYVTNYNIDNGIEEIKYENGIRI